MLSSPAAYAAACMEGIVLWAKSVLPVLFPFFVCTGILSAAGARMADRLSPVMSRVKLPAAAALCAVTSVLSGYPVGSRAVADLYAGGRIGRGEAVRLSALCSTSRPMFVLGTVGSGMFGGGGAGAVLLAAHLLGVLSVFFVLRFFEWKRSARGRKDALSRPPAGGQTDRGAPRPTERAAAKERAAKQAAKKAQKGEK